MVFSILENMEENNKKVVIGISGGVDSSVAANLLQNEGFEVVGVFLDFWENEKNNSGFRSAKKVSKFLNIPLLKVNARKEFKKVIVNNFIRDYKRGETPNPCVWCNPNMKFKILINEMTKIGGDFVATGHYARLKKKGENFKLLRAKDKTKDQSYFLYGLKQKQLKKIIFPLGSYLKSDVRKIARKIGLSTAKRKESQDICFISDANFSDFLKMYIKNNKGDIIDMDGNILGKHYGLHFYTIGQRKGINIGGKGPYYVIDKNSKKNYLIVSNDRNNLYSDKFLIKKINWINKNLKLPLRVKLKIRYHSDFVYGIIKEQENGGYLVDLEKRQKAITTGQSAVFYLKNEVIGGGIIV